MLSYSIRIYDKNVLLFSGDEPKKKMSNKVTFQRGPGPTILFGEKIQENTVHSAIGKMLSLGHKNVTAFLFLL